MRYALFYTPPADHDLTQIASRWLGRDAYSGALLPQPDHTPFSAERLAELTHAPRRYGFHATLKAPFELSEDSHENQLVSAMERFCQSQAAFNMPKLKVGRLGPFFALVPDSNARDLNRFAAECVRGFENLRAPMRDADYARRNPDKLEQQQRAYLQKWGYPYIFDAFRFHMTLTGPVPTEEADEMEQVLRSLFDPYLQAPLLCDHLTLFREVEKAGPFTVHTSIPLAPSPARKAPTL